MDIKNTSTTTNYQTSTEMSTDIQHTYQTSQTSQTSTDNSTETLIRNNMLLFTQYLDKSRLEHKPHQFDGVKWCLYNELRPDPPCNTRGGFIADEMGLGKTILMIGTLVANKLSKTLIVVPPILIDQWYSQILKTTGHKSFIFHGKNKLKFDINAFNRTVIVITTYGAISITRNNLIAKKYSLLHNYFWNRIIFDEGHHLRNNKTLLYSSIQLLQSNIRWIVSGTPIHNSKNDFYNLCSVIRLPTCFYTDIINLRELASSFILKRTKKQIGISLSDLLVNNTIVDWQNTVEMNLAIDIHSQLQFSKIKHSNKHVISQSFATQYHKGKTLALMCKAKQSCIMPQLLFTSIQKLVRKGVISNFDQYNDAFLYNSKIDSVIHSIHERKDNGSGKIVFCNFKLEIQIIYSKLIQFGFTVAVIDGNTSRYQRNRILLSSFNVLILQIQTGCEGLNLQDNYSEIYFVSPHWNPAIEDQAIARCHRIGQTKPVFIQRFSMASFTNDNNDDDNSLPLTLSTIDNHINNIQDDKRTIANQYISVS